MEAAFKGAVSGYGLETGGLVRISQQTRNGVLYDTEDRVLFGIRLVTDLLSFKPRQRLS